MKALGVSLLIAAAVAASFTVARTRQPERSDEQGGDRQALPSEPVTDLDAIRSAGL